MKKIGRPREYRDKAHKQRAEYMVGWYHKNRERLLAIMRDDRKNNPEKYRERDRARYEKDKRIRTKLANKWKANNPDKRRESARSWYRLNRHKKRASTTVRRAIVMGQLVRKPCVVCGALKNVQAHHEDYSKPLDVVWMCVKHHNEHHKKQRAIRRATP